MKYFLREGQDKPYVEVTSEEEFLKEYGDFGRGLSLFRFDEKVRHCKADIFEKVVHGSFFVPSQKGLGYWGRFCFDEEKLIFITDGRWIENILSDLFSRKSAEAEFPAQILFAFIDELIKDEGERIDDVEEALNDKESEMLEKINSIPEDFDHYMQKIRKNLLAANRYYQQLGDMVQMLADSPDCLTDERTKRMFRFLSERIDRLSSDALNLREYSAQLYDMYQARVNSKQNKIMQFLTVITTIFMPLTLITGWYGMNFENMPETGWKYGYIGVAGLSALLLVIEYIIFKRKKWM